MKEAIYTNSGSTHWRVIGWSRLEKITADRQLQWRR